MRVEARLAIEERRLPALGQPLQRLLRRLEREGAARGEALGRRARVARLEEELLRLPQRIVHRERLQRAHVRLAPAALARRDRKDASAAQRGGMGARGAGEPGGGGVLFCLGQGATEQEAQAGDGRRRLREPQLPERPLSRGELHAVDERDHARHLRRADVREEPGPIAQRPRRPGQELQLDVEHLRGAHRGERARLHQGGSARRVLHLHAGEVGRGALAGARLVDRAAVHLDAAHPHPAGLRAGAGEVHLVAGSERSGEERSRHHRAEALDREGAIERQEERRLFRPRRGLPRPHRVGHRGHQLAQALTGPGGHLHDLRLLEEGALHQLAQFQREDLAMVRPELGQEIGLGHGDDAGLHAEKPQHVEVLRGLGHGALVRRHAEHRHVDPSGGRHHGAEEPLVAGHVHHSGRADAGQVQVRVARLERDAAALLLRQPIRVDARERLHQRGLAVVDVAGGADDDSQRAAVHSSAHPTPGASLPRSSDASPRSTATGDAQ